jgi:RNA polymerase sigma factor (sigma-70 family)
MPAGSQHKVMKLRSDNSKSVRDTPTVPVKPSIENLFDTEESPLLRYAYGMVRRREIAEDIVQDAFLKLHKHWEDITTPRAWLYRATRNLCLNHLRKHKRETLTEESDRNPSLNDKPDEQLSRMEAIGTLRILIEELPAADRKLIQLKYQDELTYSNIGKHLDLGAGTVGYKLHHLLKDLSLSLQKSGINSSRG